MSYDYSAAIKDTSEMGIGSDGNLDQLKDNVSGLKSYVNLFTTNDTTALKTGKYPLGNVEFIETDIDCTPIEQSASSNTKAKLNKYVFNLTEGGGLILSIVDNIKKMNPMALMSGGAASLDDKCIAVSMPTITQNSNGGSDYKNSGWKYVPVNDIKAMKAAVCNKSYFRQHKNTFKVKNSSNKEVKLCEYSEGFCNMNKYLDSNKIIDNRY